MTLVTRNSLMSLLSNENKRPHVIGRALVAIFNNQTRDEQSTNHTVVHNNIGFTGADAKSGSITAKYYLKHKNLLPWQVDQWMKDFKGFPRITKYTKQLNLVAQTKATQQAQVDEPGEQDEP
jgi:hypothetical protein